MSKRPNNWQLDVRPSKKLAVAWGSHCGKGTLQHSNGYKFEGEWLDGKFHGHGAETLPCGDSYVGEWHLGKRHGQGVETFASGTVVVGNWFEGQLQGRVFVSFANQDTYSGDWLENEPHGTGCYTCADGTVYTGEFERGKRHGLGTETRDGNSVSGTWCDGEYQGGGPQKSLADLKLFREMCIKEGACDSVVCEKSHVYIIRQGTTNMYKIGFSKTSVQSRLRQLQTGNHLKLTLARVFHGGQDTEMFLHERYRKFRQCGEWFKFQAGDCFLLT